MSKAERVVIEEQRVLLHNALARINALEALLRDIDGALTVMFPGGPAGTPSVEVDGPWKAARATLEVTH